MKKIKIKNASLVVMAACIMSCTGKKEPVSPFEKVEVKKEILKHVSLNEVHPGGWLKELLEQDMQTLTGRMDEMAPNLFGEDLYDTQRLTIKSNPKELGNALLTGDSQVEYLWWNSETQSNWRDGYVRTSFYTQNPEHLAKTKQYIDKILASQDEDGYLGIYSPELRYKFAGENGEFWAKASLMRGMLAYYEFTKDERVLNAVKRGIDNVMENYKINESNPYKVTNSMGGICHGLVLTDVLDKLYSYTGDQKYWDYALFMYKDYSENELSQPDVQYKNILDTAYKFVGHGVHTYEHVRPLLVATYASGNDHLTEALNIYLDRVETKLTPSGAPIGDEFINGRDADATNIGYEYCSLQELFDSYMTLTQKTGDMKYADKAEKLFVNAALGARSAGNGSICYLKTDNSYEMSGTRNGADDADKGQTRYKYSYVHQDNAACCSPNAARIVPYYVGNMWMKDDKGILSVLFGTSEIETLINDKKVSIKQITDFPNGYTITYTIETDVPVNFALKIRKPVWAQSINVDTNYEEKDGMLVLNKEWNGKSEIHVTFEPSLSAHKFNGETFFSYGADVLALPIEATEYVSRMYVNKYPDLMYKSVKERMVYQYGTAVAEKKEEELKFPVALTNPSTNKTENHNLIPIRQTILRQVTFK